jgi:hypothetical protein
MNKNYRVVWNESTETWVAVPEVAKGRGKGKSKAARKAVAGGALVAAGAGMFSFAPTAMAGSIINCGPTSYASFSSGLNGWNGQWSTGENNGVTGSWPATCVGGSANNTGVTLSENGNYFSPDSTNAAIVVGATNTGTQGVVSLYGRRAST